MYYVYASPSLQGLGDFSLDDLVSDIQNALPSFAGGTPLTDQQKGQLATQMAADMTKAATNPVTGQVNQDLISQMMTNVPNSAIFNAAVQNLPGASGLFSNVPWGPNNPGPNSSTSLLAIGAVVVGVFLLLTASRV